MKPSVEEIGSLLALKRHERPEEGYFDDFLREFHQRRREEEALKTGPAGWLRRASAWFSNLGASRWAYGAGLAYATVMALFLLAPDTTPVQSAPPVPVNYKVAPAEPAAVEQLEALDLRPSSQGSTGEQEF
ncbi:hypothetical protein [Luteolibacter luteus]|uniref:Uncharacterized protein n=1 Tax=Luteolibacter luteus TaxID=2728835 RepID=A0A858RE45_9BACT|nr:hypothetical protein [Luteolibacter luteus]QJE95087.1 hypothetical protein HHL09_04630 [Luteolibacter luteus]